MDDKENKFILFSENEEESGTTEIKVPVENIENQEEKPEIKEEVEEEIPEIEKEFQEDISEIEEPLVDKTEEMITSWEEPIINSEENAFEQANSLQGMINKILKIDKLEPVRIPNQEEDDVKELETKEEKTEPLIFEQKQENLPKTMIFKSDVLERLQEESKQTGILSILARYGDDFCAKDYVTHPAIGREEEIKQLNLTLLTPEKSAILVGKPGIGKTSIVEGLAYDIQRGDVPDLLKGYSIISIKTPSLLGTLPTGETRLQTLVDELKPLDKVILFIDEIHMLIGANNDSAMDFANMFKESLGRGQIKLIGATTTEEYERYILRDKAFARRFQSIEILEPSREHTIKILMGTLPKIEKETGAKMKYTSFQQSEIMAFLTDITSEYRRIYGIGSRYPDICLTLLKQAFSQAMFENRKEVNIIDVRNAIENSTNIYPDVIKKELINFDIKFKKMIDEEKGIITE